MTHRAAPGNRGRLLYVQNRKENFYHAKNNSRKNRGHPSPNPATRKRAEAAHTAEERAGAQGQDEAADRTRSHPGKPRSRRGGVYSLALKTDGTVWAWGANNFGQIGDNTTTNRDLPKQVPGLSGIIAVAAGWYYSLALKSDGTVWAWGQSEFGQLINGSTSSRVPVQISGLTGVAEITAGSNHVVVRKTNGTIFAWGTNYDGRLGDGTTTDSNIPVQANISSATAISAGWVQTVALKSDGTAWASCGRLPNIPGSALEVFYRNSCVYYIIPLDDNQVN